MRGGGHNTNPGWASIDGSGVLIDLQKIKTLSLSDDKKLVKVGPGNRWGDVAPFLDKYEMSAVGGRHLQVGVGGVILGGKRISTCTTWYTDCLKADIPFSPRCMACHATTCKTLRSFLETRGLCRRTVVRIQISSRSSRAGGTTSVSHLYIRSLSSTDPIPYVGIVTRFDLYTTPTHKIWYRSFALNGTDSNSSKIIEAAVQVEKNMGSDAKAQLLFNAAFGRYLVTFIYAEEADNPAVFRPLEGFPEVSVPPGAPPPIPPTNGTVLDFHKLETNPDTPG